VTLGLRFFEPAKQAKQLHKADEHLEKGYVHRKGAPSAAASLASVDAAHSLRHARIATFLLECAPARITHPAC
jgi:hypothetical protein